MPKKYRKKSKQAEEVFHVEVITKARVSAPDEVHAESYWEYFVKWAGYESDANSWEPEDNLAACQRLLSSFWDHVGLDNKDYYPGYELKASKEWIEHEKAFYAAGFKTAQDEIKRLKDEKRKGKQAKKEKGKSESAPVSEKAASSSKTKHTTSPDTDSDSSSSEDTPISKKSTPQATEPRLTITINTKKRKQVITSSSEEEPLLTNKNARPHKIHKGDKPNDANNEVIEISSSPENQNHSPNSLFSRESSPERDIMPKLTKKPGLPKFTRRSTNPQATIAAMSPSEIPQAGGILTKQRLAMGALQPTAPKNISGAELHKPPQKLGKQKFANLHFKRRQDSSQSVVEESSQSQNNSANEPTLASLNTPTIESSRSALASPAVGFSQPAQRLVQKRVSVSEPTVAPSMVFPQQASMSEVDSFLGAIMPPELSAPMNSTQEPPSMEMPPPKALHTRVPLPSRLQPKVWKWTGPLYTKSDEPPFCNVMVHNTTKETSLRFSIVFDKLEKIDMTSMYDFKETLSILSVFRPPSQSAQLSPAGETDIQRLGVLAHYMQEKRKVCMIPIRLDNNTIGQILCVPLSLQLTFNLEAPAEMDGQSGHLLMAILPYKLDPVDIEENPHIHPATRSLLPAFDFETFNALDHPRLKKNDIRFYNAMDMLRFSFNLYEYVSDPQHKRPYTIWSGLEPANPQHKARKGLETRLLEDLMTTYAGVKRVNNRTSARMVFIHLSALNTVHRLPDFVERRVDHPYVQFYHYGSDPSIPPHLWKTEEIWPCGGIVTFTPDALAKSPTDARELIRKIDSHPLWAGYILPAVLGIVAYMECGKEDALAAFDSHELKMDPILEEIAEGRVAILEAPPEKPTVSSSKDINSEWLSKYVALLPPTRRQALAKGVKGLEEFRALPAQSKSINGAIMADLTRMQRHPAFMYDYRRYIVVCGESDGVKVNTFSDGFEWTTIEKFDFKDDFFVKQDVGTR